MRDAGLACGSDSRMLRIPKYSASVSYWNGFFNLFCNPDHGEFSAKATVQIRCYILACRTLEETVCPACWRPSRMARIPGICFDDMESARPWPDGYIVRELSRMPSNFRCESTMQAFLEKHDIPGIAGIDTR